MLEIRDTPLSLDECFAAVLHPGAGGVCLFIGVVRDHNDGQPVERLEYEAYRSMAEKELRAIASEIEREIPGTRLSCLHRIGALHVGDVAVVCAASAPHRDEAFSSCRLLIDRIKERVPIWKREQGPNGMHWVGWQEG